MKASKLCKIRGITLNYHASNLLNFEVISVMILEQCEPIVNVHTEHNFKRNTRACGTVAIVSEPENKKYRISFKRRRMHEHSSVLFGYNRGGSGERAVLQPDPP